MAYLSMVMAALVMTMAHTQAPQTPGAMPVRNFLRVNTEFCTGGQPQPEAFARLKSEGVRAVLSLRVPTEYRAPEELQAELQAVKDAGLKYFNIPVVYSTPKESDADEFLKITDDPANRPMFIHCTAAIRAGAFWLIRRVLRDHWTWDDALAEAKKVGLVNAPHLETFAKTYIEKHQTGAAGAAAAGAGEWTGRLLTGIVAIGGESTGVVLEVGQDRFELQLDANQRKIADSLKGQQVTVKGKLETRQGVEVPTRRIIVVTDIVKK